MLATDREVDMIVDVEVGTLVGILLASDDFRYGLNTEDAADADFFFVGYKPKDDGSADLFLFLLNDSSAESTEIVSASIFSISEIVIVDEVDDDAVISEIPDIVIVDEVDGICSS